MCVVPLLVERVCSSVFLQCCIDLKKNVLRIGTTGTEASFLTEADLKDKEMVSQAKKQVGTGYNNKRA